eukprot:m.20061 g.20061  ORF g.20061 m.20061 type:complete len:352 (+) comp3498_c0_seq1:30-1085(+)
MTQITLIIEVLELFVARSAVPALSGLPAATPAMDPIQTLRVVSVLVLLSSLGFFVGSLFSATWTIESDPSLDSINYGPFRTCASDGCEYTFACTGDAAMCPRRMTVVCLGIVLLSYFLVILFTVLSAVRSCVPRNLDLYRCIRRMCVFSIIGGVVGIIVFIMWLSFVFVTLDLRDPVFGLGFVLYCVSGVLFINLAVVQFVISRRIRRSCEASSTWDEAIFNGYTPIPSSPRARTPPPPPIDQPPSYGSINDNDEPPPPPSPGPRDAFLDSLDEALFTNLLLRIQACQNQPDLERVSAELQPVLERPGGLRPERVFALRQAYITRVQHVRNNPPPPSYSPPAYSPPSQPPG